MSILDSRHAPAARPSIGAKCLRASTGMRLTRLHEQGEITKDPVYMDAERRFQDLETETKKLHEESKKYFDAINSMLNHQIEFSKACAEIYKPISGRMSDPDSFLDEGNPEGIRACEQYESIVQELKEIGRASCRERV